MPWLEKLRSWGGNNTRSNSPGCDAGGSRASAVGLRDTGVPMRVADHTLILYVWLLPRMYCHCHCILYTVLQCYASTSSLDLVGNGSCCRSKKTLAGGLMRKHFPEILEHLVSVNTCLDFIYAILSQRVMETEPQSGRPQFVMNQMRFILNLASLG